MTATETFEEKNEALSDLWDSTKPAIPAGKRPVFGEGNVNARLAIVGEAPGRQEELAGHPFVGRAGQLLDTLLADSSIKREQVWITNVVKYRPTVNENSSRNRTPTPKEIESSSESLVKELEVISPKIIFCLGRVPSSALIKKDFTMNQEHGVWFKSIYSSMAIATFHPAYVLRLSVKRRMEVLELMRADFNKVKLLHEFYLAQ
jgi:uracil-DNA glycosylase family 4